VRAKLKPPIVIDGCRVEHYAIRDRSMKYAGSGLFSGGKEVGPVPRLAICRDRNGLCLLHCDSRWRSLGAAGGYSGVREAKQRAERIYPGISRAWNRTGYTKRQATNYLDRTGGNLRCSVCRKKWYQVEQVVTVRRLAICDGCIRELGDLLSPATT
jgi:hypothetical protein